MSALLSGYLFWADWEAVQGSLAKLKRLHVRHERPDGWRLYEYSVQEKIPRVEVDTGPPFVHALMIRGAADRLIVMSHDSRICKHFMEKDLRPAIQTTVRRADILVHELVIMFVEFRTSTATSLAHKIGDSDDRASHTVHEVSDFDALNRYYALGYSSGLSDAFAGNLQRAEFEGDDLPLTSLFTAATPLVRFRSCGIRRKVVDDQGYPSTYELLRLGKTGFLSFSMPASTPAQSERFREVESLLRSLNRLGFIK